MLLRLALSTIIPQMGYRNTLPLSKYEAAVLASNSVSPNRRSKIFLRMHNLSPMNRRLEFHTYGARWKKGCQIEPHRTFNAIYLSEMVIILPSHGSTICTHAQTTSPSLNTSLIRNLLLSATC